MPAIFPTSSIKNFLKKAIPKKTLIFADEIGSETDILRQDEKGTGWESRTVPLL